MSASPEERCPALARAWNGRDWPRRASLTWPPGNAPYFGAPGSGGFGDPLLREPERVLAHVKPGAHSAGVAKRFLV